MRHKLLSIVNFTLLSHSTRRHLENGAPIIRCDYGSGWDETRRVDFIYGRCEASWSVWSSLSSSRTNKFACIYWRWRSSGLSRFFSLFTAAFPFSFVFFVYFLKNRARQFRSENLFTMKQKSAERGKKNIIFMLHLTNGAETEQLLAMSSVFKRSFSSLAVFFSFCRRKKLLADIVNYTFFFLLIALFFNATFIDFLSRFLYFSFFFFSFAGKRLEQRFRM